tara:strand:+ start:3888 stop:4040 length:153 start_codon:yes stop_codon:yes gene_type:complete
MLGEEKLLLVILTMLIVICFYVSSVDEKRKTMKFEKDRLELLEAVKRCNN